ncbi:MAG TPA: ScyD/ScyE family protein [Pyrinomonadaceae bacterium]
MNPRKIALTISVALACVLACVNVLAQATSTPFASGLKAPTKSVLTGRGNLLVAEAGNGPNTGRLSLIDRNTGARRTILDGLPSGINALGGAPAPSGPSGLALAGDTLYMTISTGDSVEPGPNPGTEKESPAPSSPIMSSVLSIRASSNVETGTASFALTSADHTTLKNGGQVVLSTALGETLTIELVVDFPNFVAEPRPDFPANVRASNPFGVAVSGGLLYVNDAGLNLVKTVGIFSHTSATLTTFAPIARTSMTPPGPPVMDAVPDSVRLYGDQLLVTLLTGFPFEQGRSEVRKVDLVGGGQTTFIGGLSTAIDMHAIRRGSNPDHFLVLEFSTNMLGGAPGRMLYFSSTAGPPFVFTSPLVSPTSISRDRRTGDVFITQIFPGLVARVDGARFFVRQHYLDFLGREPDIDGWDFWTNQIASCGNDEGCRDRKQVDVSRAFYYSGEFIAAHPELAANLRGTTTYNRAFVKQAYLTYLQRTCDPEVCDAAGFNFWVNILNSKIPNTDAHYNEMIRAFILSSEYRARLGLS